MENLRKAGRLFYKIYVGIGIATMAFVSAAVIFAVIMRYFFGISYTFLEELITLVFAFSAFWGIGICALENEHVVIDYFYQKFPEKLRRYIDIFNYIIVLVTLGVIDYYSINWIQVAGKTISNGLRVKYVYIYSAMPIGITVSMLLIAYKLICIIRKKPVFQTRKEEFIL